MQKPAAQLWRHLVAFGFKLLYNELAFLYDPVSWIASAGRWHAWQEAALLYLCHEGTILEVGCGPGHLLADMLSKGHQVMGLDLSLPMLHLARRRLNRCRFPVSLCRGQATTLPFAMQTFRAIVCTFPTTYIFEPAWIEEAARILQEGGSLVIVEMATFPRRSLLPRSLEWLYRATGQRDPTPDLVGLLGQSGLTAWRERVEVYGSSVSIVLAYKPADQ